MVYADAHVGGKQSWAYAFVSPQVAVGWQGPQVDLPATNNPADAVTDLEILRLLLLLLMPMHAQYVVMEWSNGRVVAFLFVLLFRSSPPCSRDKLTQQHTTGLPMRAWKKNTLMTIKHSSTVYAPFPPPFPLPALIRRRSQPLR